VKSLTCKFFYILSLTASSGCEKGVIGEVLKQPAAFGTTTSAAVNGSIIAAVGTNLYKNLRCYSRLSKVKIICVSSAT
jgi:hypothetical protein